MGAVNMPKVSVVVPNYNHARFLRQRIVSVLGQTYRDFEMILLDDCSTDESRSILSEYAVDARVRLEFNEKNSGSTFKQWNRGVRLARGEYVWIAESDDYAEAQFLEKLVARLDAEPDAVFCNCRSWRISSDGEIIELLDSWVADLDAQKWTVDHLADGREECRKYLVRRNTIPNASSVVFRKEVYERVGGADERLVYCGDWKLWASMALTGGAIAYVGQPLNYYRWHESTVRSKSERLGIDALEYLHVVGWILQNVTPTEATREKACAELFWVWYPRVLTNEIPFARRWAILRDARGIDRHALRKLVHQGLVALRTTIFRHSRSLRSRF
jgi:glycosyltransferase involved in cell wall biosynthesis